MSRITSKFDELKREGRKGFIPFVTAGDPDEQTSLEIILTLARLGADIIELGVPFSDPMADGPVIQRSSARALAGGTNLGSVLEMAARFRQSSDVPLVLFTYFNPLMSFGLENFVAAAGKAGIDGVLLTDVIDDEAAVISQRLAAADIDLISLVAPTTSDTRLRSICDASRGFIYAVSRAGVTGAQSAVSASAETLVARVRHFTELPVVVGFGISTPEQVENVCKFADAAVIGSAIVDRIEKANSRQDALTAVESFVVTLLPGFAKTGAEI